MDLGNVEVSPNLLLDKLVLSCMKAVPSVFEPLERVVGVRLEVSVVYEIKDSTGCLYDFRVSCVCNYPKKDLLHVLVFVSGPLGDKGYPFLEMAKTRVPSHRLETSVDLVFPIDECFGDPLNQVVLEDTLMELMKDIGGEGGEDITEGEIHPEWINGAQAVLGERLWRVTVCSKVKCLESVASVSK